MRLLSEVDIFIFDCDGVIFNSNDLKIQAMTETLVESGCFNDNEVVSSIKYFRSNFGVSRNTHINFFVKKILKMEGGNAASNIHDKILLTYSMKCVELYREAEFTPGVESFIRSVPAVKYVASGSDELELNDVFKYKGVDVFFQGVYGSPKRKRDIVKNIAIKNKDKKIVMIGDAISDFEAADKSGVSFYYYSPYSNVKKDMAELKSKHGFFEFDNFGQLLNADKN